MKKILFISPHVDNYGAERSLVSLMKGLNERGYQTFLIIPRQGKIEDLLKRDGLQYLVHPFYLWIGNIVWWKKSYICLRIILQDIRRAFALMNKLKVRRFTPDIIQTNVVVTPFGYILSKLVFHCPHVWHIREFANLDFNMHFIMGNNLTMKIVSSSSVVLANSNAVRDHYINHYKVDKEKIKTIWNGIDIHPLLQHDFSKNPFKLIIVGRLGVEKGQRDIINSMGILKQRGYNDIYLDIYGNGSDKINLVNLVKNNNIQDKVAFKGYSNSIDYTQYHAGIMCSPYEAFGRVTIEYMMNGLPVVAANSGGSSEIIEVTGGLLYEVGDYRSLADKVGKLYEDRNLCISIVNNAYNGVTKYFSTERYIKDFEGIYEKL